MLLPGASALSAGSSSLRAGPLGPLAIPTVQCRKGKEVFGRVNLRAALAQRWCTLPEPAGLPRSTALHIFFAGFVVKILDPPFWNQVLFPIQPRLSDIPRATWMLSLGEHSSSFANFIVNDVSYEVRQINIRTCH